MGQEVLHFVQVAERESSGVREDSLKIELPEGQRLLPTLYSGELDTLVELLGEVARLVEKRSIVCKFKRTVPFHVCGHFICQWTIVGIIQSVVYVGEAVVQIPIGAESEFLR